MNLDEMIRTDEFMSWHSDLLGNDLFINDPDRADRIHEAAEFGGDGSMHSEVIQDWRDFLDAFADDLDLTDQEVMGIEMEIDECEEWHDKNGSLFEVIG